MQSRSAAPLLIWNRQTGPENSPFLPSCSVGLLGTIKGVGRKASGEGATRSEEFLYIRENHRLFYHSHSFVFVLYFLLAKISKAFRQILMSISLKKLPEVE